MSDQQKGIDLLLLGLSQYSVWNVAPVTDEPHIQLLQWSIRQDQDGNRYFVGVRADDRTGRVSTEIVQFDVKTRKGRTASGRVYELLGPPGRGANAEYVWSIYREINGITEVEPTS